jgi:hypothetical protein
VLGVSKINHKLLSHLKEPKIPSRASRSSLSLTDQRILQIEQSWQILFENQVISIPDTPRSHYCSY